MVQTPAYSKRTVTKSGINGNSFKGLLSISSNFKISMFIFYYTTNVIHVLLLVAGLSQIQNNLKLEFC